MTRLVRAELLKLRTTRLLLWLGLLILALEVLVIALHVSKDSLDSLSGTRNQRDVVSIAAISALISLILGIVSSAGEFAHGTIGQTFLVSPVRERVVAAKLLAGILTNILANQNALGLTAIERPVPAAGRGGLVCAHCGFASAHERAFYCPKCGMRLLRG